MGVMREVVQVMGSNGNAVVHHNENEDFGREVVNVVNSIDNVRLREQTKLRILQLVFDLVKCNLFLLSPRGSFVVRIP